MSGGRAEEVLALRRARPRSRMVRYSVAVLALLVVYSWLCGEVELVDLFSARRRANLARFLGEDALPHPLREAGFSWSGLVEWMGAIFSDRGAAALTSTLWISVLAIGLAGGFAALVAPLATRTLLARDPYLLAPDGAAPARGPGWRLVTAAVRLLLVAMRAIPEYVWAFLLLAMLGPTPWTIVLALAVHNAGILGRLGGETLENLDAGPMRGLRALGAGRVQIAWCALRPLAMPRLLLYFFYRWETCVREATVLGMLGVVSLGYWIQDARARQRYDELLFFVALGVALVLLGDLVSYAARRWVRGGA